MRKWIPLMILAAALIASAVVYPDLPDRMRDRWGSWMWRMPLLITLFWAAMRWLPYFDPRRANYAKSAGAFETMMIVAMLCVLVIHAMILRHALGHPLPEDRVFPVAMGIMLIVGGNLMPRVHSEFLGFRTPWTRSSDRVREKTQRVAGRLFVTGGLVLVAAGLAGVSRIGWVQTGVLWLCFLGSFLYSYIASRREKGAPGTPTV